MSRSSLYLIDGHAQIYRAYYAPFRNLTSSNGEPTRATFVFCQMLLNLLRDRRPDYLAMVLDVSDGTVFRVEVDAEYKAHREPPPEDLEPQMERIIQIVTALGIPILRMPGFEADDILATLAHRHGEKDADLYLVSKDKDLEQLLRDGVYLYDPGKDEIVDAARMTAAKGYPPAKAVEAQMLMGDSVDNIRGAVGVGPKKAAELLGKYGDIAGIIAHADELTPKLRENILEFAGRAEKVRTLVTLRGDVPIEFALADAAVPRLRYAAAEPIFRELSFHRLTDQLLELAGIAPASAPAGSAPSNSAGRVTTETIPLSSEGAGNSIPPLSSGGDGRGSGAGEETASQERAHRQADGMAAAPREAAVPALPGATRETISTEARVARGDYRLIDDEAALRQLAAELARVDEFAFDTETTGLSPIDCDLVGLSFSWEAGRACYVAVRGMGRTIPWECARPILAPIFKNERIGKSGQNLKYDVGVLMASDVTVRGIRFDTLVASFVLDSMRRSHGIDALAMDYFGIQKIATSELIGKGKDQLRFDALDTARVSAYACEDADVAWRLRQLFEPQLRERGLWDLFAKLELPLVEVLAGMEHNGVALDTDLLARLSNEMAARLRELTRSICDAAGRPFNIDSTKQLGEVLFDELKLPVIRRTKTGRSTDAEVLVELIERTSHPVPRLVLEYRELSKLKGTYVDPLPDMLSPRTGRIHCSFHQTGAITGRISSSDPNLQNIPIRTDAGSKIRRAFIPRAVLRQPHGGFALLSDHPAAAATPPSEEWLLVSADYSQIELRVLAHFSEDEHLIAAFRDDRDIHQFVASQVFNVPLEAVSKDQRGRAKTVNFGIIYGQTAFGLSRQTDMSVAEARTFIDAYFARYPRIQGFMDECIEHARREGYVATMLGRRRAIADIHSRNLQARSAAERLAVNTVVQGTAADIIKRAMARIHQRLRDERRPTRMLIQVHDELVFESPPSALAADAAMIREEMSGAIPLRVPLRVDVAAGPNWLDAADISSPSAGGSGLRS